MEDRVPERESMWDVLAGRFDGGRSLDATGSPLKATDLTTAGGMQDCKASIGTGLVCPFETHTNVRTRHLVLSLPWSALDFAFAGRIGENRGRDDHTQAEVDAKPPSQSRGTRANDTSTQHLSPVTAPLFDFRTVPLLARSKISCSEVIPNKGEMRLGTSNYYLASTSV